MNFVEADCRRYCEWSIRGSKETDTLMVRILQEIMPKRIGSRNRNNGGKKIRNTTSS